MSKDLKVIYSEFSTPESRMILECLKEDYNWEPVFIHGSNTFCNWGKENFPKAKRVESEALRKGEFDYSELGEFFPIDADFIHKLSDHELNYLNWLEDASGWEFSFNERRTYYYDILRYWNSVIGNTKPDLFVTYNWPHLPSDYALYLVCKYVYKIPVLFVDVVPRNNANYFNIGISLDELEAPFMDFYRSEESKEIAPVVEDYLEKLRSEEPERPWYIDRYFENYQKKMRKQLWKNRIRTILSTLLGRTFKPSNSAYKKNRLPISNPKSRMSNFDYFLFRERIRRENLKLKEIYDSMCRPIDSDEKYIFLAAPYQPEAFSNLINDVYEDIFLMIDLLEKHLPEKWTIYYKEHPATFNEMDKGALGRSKEFYRRLSSYKKIKLVGINNSSFELLDKSQAVVTTGGTIGWEAIVRGRPAVVFGSMWYVGCDSIFNVKNSEDVKNALDKIDNGFLPDKLDVNRYAQSMSMASIKDLPAPYYCNDVLDLSKDIKSQMRAVSKAYFDAFEKFYL